MRIRVMSSGVLNIVYMYVCLPLRGQSIVTTVADPGFGWGGPNFF